MVPFFTYGTLMKGECRQHMLEDSDYLGPAETKHEYSLINVNGLFPGLVLSKPSSEIQGELYLIDESLFHELDAIEGAPEMYKRVMIDLPKGSLGYGYRRAATYVVNEEGSVFSRPFEFPIIRSGSWRRR